jgi:SAM-dependent methyltransferase
MMPRPWPVLKRFLNILDMMNSAACPLCASPHIRKVHHYNEAPVGEVKLPGLDGQPYARTLYQCDQCSHIISCHSMDLDDLYKGSYVDATYGGEALRRTYEKIRALPQEQSDNVGRVICVNQWLLEEGGLEEGSTPRLLDVGSGLGVFPAAMKTAGWQCTGLDPDPRAAEHLRKVVDVEGLCGDFLTQKPKAQYELVTFNKVLEHVMEPVTMLAQTRAWLSNKAYIYIELPDAEGAQKEGYHREEFFLEHHHVFSRASLSLLVKRAGFKVCRHQSLQEPSSKYTLRALLTL